GIALLQRTEPGKKSELLISYKQENSWSRPESLIYPYKNLHPYYAQRTLMISSDLSTFYFTQNGLLWQQSLKTISGFNSNKIKHSRPHKPLPVASRTFGEPSLFGNVTLKTNNGISFTKQMDTIYISQYTNDKDSTGNFHIKVFESIWKNKRWKKPYPVAFNTPSAPFEYHPVVSPVDNSIYYNSRAALEKSTTYESKNNIWRWE